jgi:acyl carrier protein
MKAEETTLFGDGAGLDSFELVRLILSIEREVNEEFGVALTLADEKAMSQRNSPFRSAGTMANYIVQLIGESNRG